MGSKGADGSTGIQRLLQTCPAILLETQTDSQEGTQKGALEIGYLPKETDLFGTT